MILQSKIKVQNFLEFEDFELNLENNNKMHTFIGPNGAGKTTILKLLEMFYSPHLWNEENNNNKTWSTLNENFLMEESFFDDDKNKLFSFILQKYLVKGRTHNESIFKPYFKFKITKKMFNNNEFIAFLKSEFMKWNLDKTTLDINATLEEFKDVWNDENEITFWVSEVHISNGTPEFNVRKLELTPSEGLLSIWSNDKKEFVLHKVSNKNLFFENIFNPTKSKSLFWIIVQNYFKTSVFLSNDTTQIFEKPINLKSYIKYLAEENNIKNVTKLEFRKEKTIVPKESQEFNDLTNNELLVLKALDLIDLLKEMGQEKTEIGEILPIINNKIEKINIEFKKFYSEFFLLNVQNIFKFCLNIDEFYLTIDSINWKNQQLLFKETKSSGFIEALNLFIIFKLSNLEKNLILLLDEPGNSFSLDNKNKFRSNLEQVNKNVVFIATHYLEFFLPDGTYEITYKVKKINQSMQIDLKKKKFELTDTTFYSFVKTYAERLVADNYINSNIIICEGKSDEIYLNKLFENNQDYKIIFADGKKNLLKSALLQGMFLPIGKKIYCLIDNDFPTKTDLEADETFKRLKEFESNSIKVVPLSTDEKMNIEKFLNLEEKTNGKVNFAKKAIKCWNQYEIENKKEKILSLINQTV